MDDDPIEWPPKTVSFPQISEEMVNSLALGLEDDLVVAARHGLSVEDYQKLAAQPWFQVAVATKRADFEKNGVTFRAKAAWMAGELLDKVYMQAAGNDASFSQTHDALKTMIRAAGLEPKEEKGGPTGPSFSISIDLGGQSVQLTAGAQPARVIEAEVKEILP